jgi:RNA polymerase sigma-70 factor (ECF subfamily)
LLNTVFSVVLDIVLFYSLKKNEIFIKKLQEGSQKAWKELVIKYNDKLYGYALSLCFDHSIASDIVQQVFINVYEYRLKLKPNHSLESFLFKSIYNRFISLYHKNKSLSRLHEQYYYILEKQLNDTSDDDLSKNIEEMKLLINSLPEKTKDIFSLKKINGLTNKEIAEYHKISLKGVEAHITKAFKILRGKIKKHN